MTKLEKEMKRYAAHIQANEHARLADAIETRDAERALEWQRRIAAAKKREQ